MKTEYLQREAGLLSVGNQQKVVIIRQVCSGADVLLLDEPTKGIDIGVKTEVYCLSVRQRACRLLPPLSIFKLLRGIGGNERWLYTAGIRIKRLMLGA